MEPSKGSGGVQHGRSFPNEIIEIDVSHIPTIAFIRETISEAQDEVERMISFGLEYAEKFLK